MFIGSSKTHAVIRILLVAVFLLVLIIFHTQGYGEYLSFEYLKSKQAELMIYYFENPASLIGVFMIAYIVMVLFSFPGATVATLLGGAIFGFWNGLLIVSFASTIGALLAFLSARYVLHDYVERKYGHRLEKIYKGVERDGAMYLFVLRLLPFVPFFAINFLFGLSKMRAWTFTWVSQLGMLLGTSVYVYAGMQLGTLESMSDILSPELISAFLLLSLFPLAMRKLSLSGSFRRFRK